MKNIFRRVTGWKNGVVNDCALAIFEAIVVLIFSSLPLITRSLIYAFHNSGVGFVDAFIISYESTIRSTEMMVYITAILSSSTAYFLFRIHVLKSHLWFTRIILVIIFVLIWLATLLFIAGLETDPENKELVVTFGNSLLITALFVWWILLFKQRHIFEKTVSLSKDNLGDEIAKKITEEITKEMRNS